MNSQRNITHVKAWLLPSFIFLLATLLLSTGCGNAGAGLSPDPVRDFSNGGGPRARTIPYTPKDSTSFAPNPGGEVRSFGQEISVEGNIVSLLPTGFTLGSKTFLVTPTSILRDARTGQPITLADLNLNDFVVLDADRDGPLYELREMARTDGPTGQGTIEVEGPIQDLTADSLTLLGITFFVTETTVLVDDDDNPIEFSTLLLGDYVELDGVPVGVTYEARHIELEDPGQGDPGELEVRGVIEALGADRISVQGYLFKVLPTTRVLDDNDNPIPFTDLEVGQLVEVEGVENPDAGWDATEIQLEGGGVGGPGEIKAQAPIAALTETTISLLGFTFNVTADTEVLDEDENPIDFADLVLGEPIEVEAIEDGAGGWEAILIEQKDGNGGGPGELDAAGVIEVITADSFTVLGITFVIVEGTIFLDINDNPITFADFAVGDLVDVEGLENVDGTFDATTLQLDDD